VRLNIRARKSSTVMNTRSVERIADEEKTKRSRVANDQNEKRSDSGEGPKQKGRHMLLCSLVLDWGAGTGSGEQNAKANQTANERVKGVGRFCKK